MRNIMEVKEFAHGFEGQGGYGHRETEERRDRWGMGTENVEWELTGHVELFKILE